MVFGMQMVDVFGAGPLAGNPLAVITGAEALSTEDMQRLTRWFNLSETAFLLPPTHPQADYRVRIFTLIVKCRLPGTRRSAVVMPGSPRRVCRAMRRRSSRSAGRAW